MTVASSAPLAVADGEVRTAAHLPWIDIQGTVVASNIAIHSRVKWPRGSTNVNTIVEAMVVT